MTPASIHGIYFSATGTTKKVTETFARTFTDAAATSFSSECAAPSTGKCDFTSHDLLRHPLTKELTFGAEDFVAVGSPVYSGRAAPIALQSLKWLRGNKTPAVILVTYGNRAYDDALVELQDFLEERGFIIVGAGAFVARHAVFPRYAVGRPDEDDLGIARDFSIRIREKLADAAAFEPGTLRIKGNRPYRKPVDMTLYPRASEACIGCGACAAICPVKVINPKNPRQRPRKGCLSCAACIHTCPQKARSFGGFVYTFFDVVFDFIFRVLFFWKKKVRTEPEMFL